MIGGIEGTPPFVTVAAESTVRPPRRQDTDRSTARRTLWSMAPPDIERLHAVSPGEFTATRNRIAAELRKAGRPAEVEVYPARHGWTTLDSQVYDPVQAERAWGRARALFNAL